MTSDVETAIDELQRSGRLRDVAVYAFGHTADEHAGQSGISVAGKDDDIEALAVRQIADDPRGIACYDYVGGHVACDYGAVGYYRIPAYGHAF